MGNWHISLSGLSERALFIQGIQQAERVDGCPDPLLPGRGKEIEGLEVPDPQLRHAEDHFGEVRAFDLFHGIHGSGVVVLVRIETIADSGGRPPCAAAALVAGGLGYGCFNQAFGEGLGAVEVHLREPRIDDVHHAVYGDARFRNVGGNNHFSLPREVQEYPGLVFMGQPSIQGQNGQLLPRIQLGKHLDAVLDGQLPLEEDKDVALGPFAHDSGDDVADGGYEALMVPLDLRRGVDQLHRIHGGVDAYHRTAVEVFRKDFDVDRCRGNDGAELRPLPQDPLQHPQDEVDVEAALVGFVDHEHAVSGERAVPFELLEEDAVGHDLDHGLLVGPVLESHGIAHGVGDFLPDLAGNELGNGQRCDAPRLGNADDSAA